MCAGLYIFSKSSEILCKMCILWYYMMHILFGWLFPADFSTLGTCPRRLSVFLKLGKKWGQPLWKFTFWWQRSFSCGDTFTTLWGNLFKRIFLVDLSLVVLQPTFPIFSYHWSCLYSAYTQVVHQSLIYHTGHISITNLTHRSYISH